MLGHDISRSVMPQIVLKHEQDCARAQKIMLEYELLMVEQKTKRLTYLVHHTIGFFHVGLSADCFSSSGMASTVRRTMLVCYFVHEDDF